MAAPAGYRLPKRPLDKWSTRERLSLASSVKKSGDQNWVSVSRAIKPFIESVRPPDWFSQKNCALQYADLLEKAETPKRKRGEKGEREVVETPANQIVRKLTIERIEELKVVIQDEQQRYKKLKKEVEAIRLGKCDGKINEMWETLQAEKKAAEEKKKEEEQKLAEEIAERAKAQALRKMSSSGIHRTPSTVSSVSEMDESTQDSMPDTLNVETTDDEFPTTPTMIQPITIEIPQSVPVDTKPAPPTSPLLSSLLQSKHSSVDSLQQIKAEAEANHALKAANQAEALQQLTNQQIEQATTETVQTTPVTEEQPNIEEVAMEAHIKVENEVEIIADVKTEVDVESTDQVIEVESMDVKEEIVECHDMVVEETIEVTTHESPVKTQQPKQEAAVIEEVPEVEETVTTTSYVKDEVLVKDDPPSPASSISSRVSEAGSKSSSRRSKGGRGSSGARRSSIRSARRSNTDDLSSRPSDAETTDDDGDSSIALPTSGNMALSESIPNSPHSSHCSDTEDDKAYKSWKKSIMLVWRAAANHNSDLRRKVVKLFQMSILYNAVSDYDLTILPVQSGQLCSQAICADDLSSRPSDAETTDDDGDSSIALPTSGNMALSESIPNSPHSSHCSDTEDDKAYKSWKKSIMLVWRAAANHKYANVFLHPVTDDIAPGYSIVVKRPKDLTIIKRHIENGTIRTTSEFQRDMMLMFTNAIMYNNSNHDVYRMAIEMYNDVLEQIEQYVSTQIMVQNTEAKLLRPTRRNESSDKEEESRRRRTSSEAEGGKSKKRKSRADET
ncbi:bromodomain-containing protein 8-like [Ruditapes philippinarum]|uniref:bromodomain-containing protein 8-like n=1 Tax=Ruditapes philippinarum TaxID=129788 RepID=UPI00295C30C2|nr:bromodomain-containing protein 8-like [Ruditapes philippinarum]